MAGDDCNGLAWFQCQWEQLKEGWNTATDVATGAWNVLDDAGSMWNMIKAFFSDPVGGSVEFFLYTTLRWIVEPSWSTAKADGETPIQLISTIQHSWMAPIVAIFLTCGILWQGIQMTISRRGEPLIRVVKAVMITAAAGGLAVVGSAALLGAGDSFSCWVIGEAIKNPDAANPLMAGNNCVQNGLDDAIQNSTMIQQFANALGLAPLTIAAGGAVGGLVTDGNPLMGVIIVVLLGLLMIVALVVQMFLLVVRGGSLIVLVGVAQLAAAGTITKATAGWPKKIIGWMLALIFYKPAAALVYATAFLFIRQGITSGADNPTKNFIFGATMLLMAVFAMPAMMKFFTWGFGSLGKLGVTAPAATGLDNIGDDVIRTGQAKKQAETTAASMPSPPAQPPPAQAPAAAPARSASSAGLSGATLLKIGNVVGIAAAATQIGRTLQGMTVNHTGAEDNE